MVKAVVLYGHPEDPDAFERHYAETHTPLAEAIPGLNGSKPRGASRRPTVVLFPTSASPSSRSTIWMRCRRERARARGRPRAMISRTCERRRDDLLRRDRLRAHHRRKPYLPAWRRAIERGASLGTAGPA